MLTSFFPGLIGFADLQLFAGCPKKIVPLLCGCCGGAEGSIISIFTYLYRSGFSVEFETLCESIQWRIRGQMGATAPPSP